MRFALALILLLPLLLLLQPEPKPQPQSQSLAAAQLPLRLPAPVARVYHPVPIAALPRNSFTHVEVEGRVALVRHEQDGDIHIRLEETQGNLENTQRKFVVVEVIPEISLTIPKVGDVAVVRGIHRYDGRHRWQELHPAEAIVIRPPTPPPTTALEKQP